MRWFRFYAGAIHDPKVQKLPGNVFKTWVNILCVACENSGKLPAIQDLAFILRMPLSDISRILETLVNQGLIDKGENLLIHNWGNRQYLSDNSTPRVRAFRERQRNVSYAVTETGPESDTESDSKKDRKIEVSKLVNGSLQKVNQTVKLDTEDPAVRKRIWEERIIKIVFKNYGTEEGTRIVGAYLDGDSVAKQIFNTLSDSLGARR